MNDRTPMDSNGFNVTNYSL